MSGSGSNFICTAIGMKRSGKSHMLAQLAARFPRRLVFDFVGEWHQRVQGAVNVETLAEASQALLAVQRREQWTVVCQLLPDDAVTLIEAVCSQKRGYARAVGGLVIETGEGDMIAPNNGQVSPVVHGIFARGRHVGPVSALFAVRRPQEIARIVTSQSDVLCAFRMHEARDAKYLADVMGSDAEAAMLKLQKHEYVRYYTNYGVLEHVAADGRVTVLRK